MHVSPKVAREDLSEYAAPRCPHCCERTMAEAPVTLDAIASHWPPPKFITIEPDGYAPAGTQAMIVSCPDCHKPSALAIDDDEIKLIAMRTETDERILKREV